MSKILLVTNYFYPWNTSGAFRWVHIGEYLNFDVLTSKKPRGGMYDKTMPGKNHRFYRHGSNLPAVLFGLYITIFVIFIGKRYEKIIFSSPPESLLIPAWICQKLGMNVYVDIRDDIARKHLTNKWRSLSWIWKFFFNRINNKVSAWYYIKSCHVIQHGYVELDKVAANWFFTPFKRHRYVCFKFRLECGLIPDYRVRPKDRTPSTFYTLRKYFKDLPKHFTEEELYTNPLYSYKQIAKQWREYLDR